MWEAVQAFWQQWCLHTDRMFYFPDRDNIARSLQLLEGWLSKKQLRQYEKDGCFFVIGNETGTKYLLNQQPWFNIAVCDATGAPTGEKYCVVPYGCDTVGDRMLSQKIWLETEEIATLRMANLTGVMYKDSVIGKYSIEKKDA